MKLIAEHIHIRPLGIEDAEELLELRMVNREFLRPFEPIQTEAHYTLDVQREIISKSSHDWEQGMSYGFGVFQNDTNELIGRVNLSNVVRGAWQSCTLGYFMDHHQNGQGFMTEAVRLVLEFAFEHNNLHRVQAAVMPRNLPSIRVIEKSGFLFEGLAKYYLHINGVWEDHNVYSLTREFWKRESMNGR
ncbi:GNAT family N-acetyltransferase [Brevibacillus ginsengisoli]|uniref:GNAT family N-acetyltransferase n=1 Tax=Brevibacillus ginsengisoli TaxID=363854 RepID=UPI003CEBA592